MHSHNSFSIWHCQCHTGYFYISDITILSLEFFEITIPIGVSIFFYFLKVDVLTTYFLIEL